MKFTEVGKKNLTLNDLLALKPIDRFVWLISRALKSRKISITDLAIAIERSEASIRNIELFTEFTLTDLNRIICVFLDIQIDLMTNEKAWEIYCRKFFGVYKPEQYKESRYELRMARKDEIIAEWRRLAEDLAEQNKFLMSLIEDRTLS